MNIEQALDRIVYQENWATCYQFNRNSEALSVLKQKQNENGCVSLKEFIRLYEERYIYIPDNLVNTLYFNYVIVPKKTGKKI